MLHQLLRRPLETDPDRPLLESEGSWTTAAELERLASRLASGLAALGLEEGDRVALLLPNGREAVVCYLACFRMRLVIVPLDYQSGRGRACQRTGDLGRYDEDGYLWFMGRRKDIIVRAGNKVAPLEVEAALSDHPTVREACVIGVPDAASGEVPHAYVILQPEAATSPEELRDFVAERLAEFMVPAEVHLIAEMPSKGPGKIDRELLRMRAITAALIEQVPFFRNAGSDFLRDIIPRLDARQCEPGETLVYEGDVGDEMYFLTKGQVEVLRGDSPQRLAVVREGSFFGELAILRDAPRAATIRALTDVEVYALRRDSVLELARTHADFNDYLQAAAREYA